MEIGKFNLIKTEGRARLCEVLTAHGVVQTPVFRTSARQVLSRVRLTRSTSKGLAARLSCPTPTICTSVRAIRSSSRWAVCTNSCAGDGPMLTDSGGFQVFSLATLRKIKEEGVTFHSHVDGRKIFMGPEESMRISPTSAPDIAMAFDECIENPAPREYVKTPLTVPPRWLKRCKTELDRLNTLPDTVNPHQLLFGINQGGTYDDLRIGICRQLRSWICRVMPSAVLPSVKAPRSCTIFSMLFCRMRSSISRAT